MKSYSAIALPLYFIINLLITPTAHAAFVEVKWEYENFPLKIELHEPEPGTKFSISKTGFLANEGAKETKPFGERWKKNSFDLTPGDSRPFVLVIKNESDKDKYFFATPHVVHPEHSALGYHFECLCNHNIFKVPAKSTWYRVVRLQIWKEYKAKKLGLIHTIVGVPEQDALTKFKARLQNE